MTGKELIKMAFGLKETERIPWVPFVGAHGGNLVGQNAEEYLSTIQGQRTRQLPFA